MTAQSIRKSRPAAVPANAPAPVHGAEIVVPLNRLKASPRNARKTPHSPAAIEALAASIRSKGVLQPPVVEIERDGDGAPTGSYLVTIGEGRRQALLRLAKRKAIKRTHPVKVVVDTENDAHEISLDENITREAMHPADQYEAFRRLAEERGYGAEEIGARFGVSAHLVRQRLRLAAAAPELMTAYRAGVLSLDQLMAFCVSDDQARQWQVFEQLGDYRPVHAIRRAMTESKVRADDRRSRFVGVEVYEAEGGAVLRDLFSDDDGGGWLEDPALLDRLVAEKLAGLAEAELRQGGWKWAEVATEATEAFGLGRVYPVEVERPDAEVIAIRRLAEEYDRIVCGAGTEDLTPEADARLTEIDAALQAFGPDFDYPPEVRARAGVMVLLGQDGLARFERGLVKAEDAATAPAARPAPDAGDDGDATGTDPKTGGAEAERDEGRGLSDRLLTDLTAHRTMGLRDAVQADADAALTTVVHALALQVFYPGEAGESVLQLRLGVTGLDRLAPGVSDGPAGRRVADRCEAWGVRLPERAAALWERLASLPPSDLLDLMACCAGVGLHAVHDPHDRRTGGRAHADALATAVGLDMTGVWSATAASYFSRVPKALMLDAVTEAAGAEEAGRIAGFKKADMAEAAERLVADRGWLPAVLRTVTEGASPHPDGGPDDGEAAPRDAAQAAPQEAACAIAAE